MKIFYNLAIFLQCRSIWKNLIEQVGMILPDKGFLSTVCHRPSHGFPSIPYTEYLSVVREG